MMMCINGRVRSKTGVDMYIICLWMCMTGNRMCIIGIGRFATGIGMYIIAIAI